MIVYSPYHKGYKFVNLLDKIFDITISYNRPQIYNKVVRGIFSEDVIDFIRRQESAFWGDGLFEIDFHGLCDCACETMVIETDSLDLEGRRTMDGFCYRFDFKDEGLRPYVEYFEHRFDLLTFGGVPRYYLEYDERIVAEDIFLIDEYLSFPKRYELYEVVESNDDDFIFPVFLMMNLVNFAHFKAFYKDKIRRMFGLDFQGKFAEFVDFVLSNYGDSSEFILIHLSDDVEKENGWVLEVQDSFKVVRYGSETLCYVNTSSPYAQFFVEEFKNIRQRYKDVLSGRYSHLDVVGDNGFVVPIYGMLRHLR